MTSGEWLVGSGGWGVGSGKWGVVIMEGVNDPIEPRKVNEKWMVFKMRFNQFIKSEG